MIALDLFAGTGWGVACQRLGIEEYGVEIMPEARATRAANGMRTAYADVWEGLTNGLVESRDGYGREAAEALAQEGTPWRVIYDLLIASPPCQTFSMAGSGAGRKALDEVLQAIEERAYLDPATLREFGEKHDPRTALVLTPLAHVARDAPLFVVFEQVPPVLPVWERCAEEMRRWGYSVWTGIVNAEQYGVPQTRRRAILIARADGGEAKMPTPTHSRYYSTGKKKGTFDEAVLPWVSMAEALGWGMTRRPFVTAGNAVGRAEGVGGSGGKEAVNREKEAGAWLVGNQKPGGRESYQDRPVEDPSMTITSNASRYRVEDRVERVGFARKADDKGEATPDGYRARDLHTTDLPAQHVTEKARSWTRSRPATTLLGDARVFAPGHKTNAEDQAAGRTYPGRPEGAERVTVAEAAALQSYPADFVWDADVPDGKGGVKPVTKTKQFLQIGNAVPPLLAEAILREVLS